MKLHGAYMMTEFLTNFFLTIQARHQFCVQYASCYFSLYSLLQLLSKPENCCGLKESEVLALLNDVGNVSLPKTPIVLSFYYYFVSNLYYKM